MSLSIHYFLVNVTKRALKFKEKKKKKKRPEVAVGSLTHLIKVSTV